jgi:hypothetical protein
VIQSLLSCTITHASFGRLHFKSSNATDFVGDYRSRRLVFPESGQRSALVRAFQSEPHTAFLVAYARSVSSSGSRNCQIELRMLVGSDLSQATSDLRGLLKQALLTQLAQNRHLEIGKSRL